MLANDFSLSIFPASLYWLILAWNFVDVFSFEYLHQHHAFILAFLPFKKKKWFRIQTCRQKNWSWSLSLVVVAVLTLFPPYTTEEPGRAVVSKLDGALTLHPSCEFNHQSAVFSGNGKRKAATTKRWGTGLNWLHGKKKESAVRECVYWLFFFVLFFVCLFNSGWRRRWCRRWSHARFRVFLHVTSLQPVRSVAIRQLRIQRRHRRTPHQVTWHADIRSNIRTVVRLAPKSNRIQI